MSSFFMAYRAAVCDRTAPIRRTACPDEERNREDTAALNLARARQLPLRIDSRRTAHERGNL